MLPATCSPVLEVFWQMQLQMPMFLASLVFFVPLTLVPALAAATLAGGIVLARTRRLLLVFLLPLEIANAAAAWSTVNALSYFDAPTEATIAVGVLGLGLAVALVANRRQWLAGAVLSGSVLCYAAAVALYGAIQHLQ